MENNLIYFRHHLNSKISGTLSNVIDVWLGHGIRNGDILERVCISNPTVAKELKISVRTVLRAKNDAENFGIIERYYDPVIEKECLKIFLRVLATFLTIENLKYLSEIFPNDPKEVLRPMSI